VCIITRRNPGELYFPRGPPRELNRSLAIRLESESKDAEDHIGADNCSAIRSVLPLAFPRSFAMPVRGVFLIKSNQIGNRRVATVFGGNGNEGNDSFLDLVQTFSVSESISCGYIFINAPCQPFENLAA